MAPITIPKNIVDGRSPPFPAGVYIGRLDAVKDQWSEDQVELAFNLTFKDNTAVGGGKEVGARPYTQRLQIIQKGKVKDGKAGPALSIVDITEFNEDVPFALQRAAGLTAQLAGALGAATTDGQGNVTLDLEVFLEDLRQGLYKDRTVIFEIQQRTYAHKTRKTADGKPEQITVSDCIRFAPVDGDVATMDPGAEPIEGVVEQGPAAAAPPAPTAARGLRTRN